MRQTIGHMRARLPAGLTTPRAALLGALFLATACSSVALRPAPAHAAAPGEVTHVRVSRIADGDCKQAPVTFGQPFVPGDLAQGKTLRAEYAGHDLPAQVDIKARNDDGSARHAIITLDAPCDVGQSGKPVALVAADAPAGQEKPTLRLADLLKTDLSMDIRLNIDGKRWQLDARDLLQKVEKAGSCDAAAVFCKRWLSGPLASEWVVGAPLNGPHGRAHPHLAAYFAVRAYGPAPIQRARVDVIVTNDWAYQKNPHNYQYSADIDVGGKSVYSVENLEHYRQARWHITFSLGKTSPLYAALDSDYLQASRAVPRYQNVQPSNKLLTKKARRVRDGCKLMKSCDQTRAMGNTGAQSAIGPIPRWSAVYVLDPEYRAYRWMLANADALGGYGVHYRSRQTQQPVSVNRHPCMTVYAAAEISPCSVPPHGEDAFPDCKNDCDSSLFANIAHHPAPAYVAYMVTGDWYYKQELALWADWVVFRQNPAYRDFKAGLVHRNQVRGQAWSLRTLSDAAYILPDNAAFKDYFNRIVANNIEWYNQNYTDNPKANRLHIVTGHFAVVYTIDGERHTGTATWQQSFFVWATGNLADHGFAGAKRLRDWFAHFQVALMTSPQFCWQLAAAYELKVRDTEKSGFYTDMGEVYRKNFPQLQGVACGGKAMAQALKDLDDVNFHYAPGSMTGYPYSPVGYPANFQIGLAAAADSSLAGAHNAWQKYTKRATQPDYSDTPQFAVIPRTWRPGAKHSQ